MNLELLSTFVKRELPVIPGDLHYEFGYTILSNHEFQVFTAFKYIRAWVHPKFMLKFWVCITSYLRLPNLISWPQWEWGCNAHHQCAMYHISGVKKNCNVVMPHQQLALCLLPTVGRRSVLLRLKVLSKSRLIDPATNRRSKDPSGDEMSEQIQSKLSSFLQERIVIQINKTLVCFQKKNICLTTNFSPELYDITMW